VRSVGASKRAIDRSPIRVHPRVSAVQKRDRPFPHPRPSAYICGSKVRSTLRQKERSAVPPSASISVYLRFKSVIAISPIRVHPRASAVQKSDRPYVKKSDRPFPHPRPSACICGSKERSPGASKRAIGLSPIRVHPRISAVQKCDRPFVKKSDRTFYKYQQARCFQRNITPCNNDIYP